MRVPETAGDLISHVGLRRQRGRAEKWGEQEVIFEYLVFISSWLGQDIGNTFGIGSATVRAFDFLSFSFWLACD